MDTTQDADVLVIFGITADLSKKMTFQALYRLEERSELNCPIVGVAVDHWSTDCIVQPLLDNPPPVHPYKPGSWGPAEADQLVAAYGGWREPWTEES